MTTRSTHHRGGQLFRLAVIICAVGGLIWLVASRGVESPPTVSTPVVDNGRINGESPEMVPGTVQEGSRIYVTSRSGAVQMCTIGAIVDDRHALTAAHCGQITDQVRMSGEPGAPAIGAISVRQTRQDLATITIYESVPIDRPSRIASTDSLPAGLAVAGHGSTSGRRTGYIPTGRVINRESDDRASISELVESTICANGGDSGGPVYQAGTDLIVGTIIAQRRPVRGECRSLLSPSSRWADPF